MVYSLFSESTGTPLHLFFLTDDKGKVMNRLIFFSLKKVVEVPVLLLFLLYFFLPFQEGRNNKILAHLHIDRKKSPNE